MSNEDDKWAKAVRLRGEVLNSFGQIELAVVGALLWAAARPDSELTTIPSLSSQRLKALRGILADGGALAKRSGGSRRCSTAWRTFGSSATSWRTECCGYRT